MRGTKTLRTLRDRDAFNILHRINSDVSSGKPSYKALRRRKTGRNVLRKPFCFLKKNSGKDCFYLSLKKTVVSMFVLLLIATPLFAGNTAVQTVKIRVDKIAEISTGGNPEIHLSSSSKEAFSEGNYSLTVNFDCNMTARINKALPEGMFLFVSLQSPSGDSFGPEVLLLEREKTVLKDISPAAVRERTIRYRLVYSGASAYEGNTDVIFTLIDS